MRRFVSHSLWGCCQFGDCSMKSLPFDISLSLGLLFTCHLLITSWSALQKLRQGCFDNHQINCWDTFCGDSWAIRSEAVVSLEIVQFPFFSRVVSQIFQSPTHVSILVGILVDISENSMRKSIPCTPWLTLPSEESEVCLAPRVSSRISARKKVRHHRTMKVMRSGTRLGIGGWVGLVGLLSFGGLKWHNGPWWKIIGIGWNWVLHLYYPPCENLVKRSFLSWRLSGRCHVRFREWYIY